VIQHRSINRRAFTLFEVALSLALVSFGVVSVLMMLPSGIKAQQMARYQILASAKALELVEAYNATHNGNPAADIEANAPWNVHSTAKNLQPDLEARVASYRYGMFPLPTDIAKRLDSDGDEIQRVLAEGGHLYYSQPLATTGFQENGFAPSTPPNEAQRLVMAVVGHPQNNALLHLPEKAWPYYAAYPSPPVHVIHRSDSDADTADLRPVGGWQAMLWEDLSLGAAGTGLRTVHQAYWAYFQVDPSLANLSQPLVDAAQAYANKAVEWCQSVGVPAACYDGQSLLTDFPAASDRHLQVVAARIMGHVGPIMLAQGLTAAGPVQFTPTTVARMHENALFLGNQFAARYPYDWGAPRPLQRAIMMDFPLIEYDLMSPPRSGTIFGTAKSASQWRAVTPHPVVNAGVSMTYPKVGTPAFWSTFWGPTTNSTLTAPFEPAERCRQIVFWAVDWQSYEDFELAPSAPVDAGRYLKYAPRPGQNFSAVCGGAKWMDHHIFGYRNPEKMIIFNSDLSGVATGTATPPGKGNAIGTHGPDHFGGQTNDQGLGAAEMNRFIGRWGADRNANQRLDRGTVPSSVRMRAVTVARFNYYDLRVPATIR
jgi:type II secretory pathway pseudopilin PulG